jgi:septal ring factor EnvC (AmiA/AmiB activator)
MNTFGKAMVVLIMVMSIVFMSFSVIVNVTHKNWREEAEKVRGQLSQAQAQNQQLQAQVDTLQKDIENERTEKLKRVAALETERENLRREFLEREREHAALVEQNRQLIAQNEAVQNNMKAQLAELDKLRADIRAVQAEKEENFQNVVKLTDRLNQAQGQLENIKNRNVQLTQQAARLLSLLDAHDINPNEPVDGVPPRVDGLVLAVNNQGMVEISLGSDDGIRRGHTLDVYRNNATTSKYLGRIQVLTTQPDKSVAKILPEFRKGLIQKEDRVATRLN